MSSSTASPGASPSAGTVVAASPGYDSWPMCQTMGRKIVCAWSRGTCHDIFEPGRAVFARVSPDGGKSWEEETLVCNTPGRGDVTVGKGLDEEGRMLLWVRHAGADGFRHRLYRSCDGKNFVCIAEPELPLDLVQITDILQLPGVGLTALFFGGSYRRDDSHYWGNSPVPTTVRLGGRRSSRKNSPSSSGPRNLPPSLSATADFSPSPARKSRKIPAKKPNSSSLRPTAVGAGARRRPTLPTS